MPGTVEVDGPDIQTFGAPQSDRIIIDAKSAFGDDELQLPDNFDESTGVSLDAPIPPPKKDNTAEDSPSEKETATPKVEKPPTTPAPKSATPPPPKAEPATPPEPQKVKINGKEFTIAEIEKEMARRREEAATPPQPVTPKQEAPQAPQYTPEQIKKAESEYIKELSEALATDVPGPTEQEIDALLAGGKDAVAVMTAFAAKTAATAVMHARKSMFAQIAPEFQAVRSQLQPLLEHTAQIQRFSTEQAFVSANPDFVPHLDLARQVAEGLLTQYPEQVGKMTQQQFLDEVARQTDGILTTEFKRWNPNTTTTWRDYAKKSAAPPAAIAPALQPPAPQPSKPKAKPPAGNSPAASAAPGPQDWHKTVAKSLQD